MVAILAAPGQLPTARRIGAMAALRLRCLRATASRGLLHGEGDRFAQREEAMRGLMSERPLMISQIIAHAALYHADT